MNFLTPDAFAKHMDPEHNYLENMNHERVMSEEIHDDEIKSNSEIKSGPIETPVTESPTPILEIVEKRRIGERNSNIPDFMRKTVAVVAHTPGVKQEDIANHFGISQPQVSNYKRGFTSNGLVDKDLRDTAKELEQTKKDVKSEILDEALSKTLSTLKILTPDDIECLGAKDKADVAVKLSKVAANLTEKTGEESNRVQIIIHAPQVRDKVHYEEIAV